MRIPADTPGGEIVVYEAPDGEVRVDVRLERETVWLSQKQMAELFDTSTDNVGLHLKNIYAEGELGKEGNVQNLHIASSENPVAVCSSVGIISRRNGCRFARLDHAEFARPRIRLRSALGIE